MFARYWLPLLLALTFPAQAEIGIRLLLGAIDTEPTKWDGSARADRGRVFRDAALDWAGDCDHEHGDAREYSLWTTQKLTDVFYSPGRFAPLFSHRRSVEYPQGHRNVVFFRRGVRPLPRLRRVADDSARLAPDTLMFDVWSEAIRWDHGAQKEHTTR